MEYSDFFFDESPIDVGATLRRYNRNTLIRTAAILSLHFGNICVPDNEYTLFSDISRKHIPHLNSLFKAYGETRGRVSVSSGI